MKQPYPWFGGKAMVANVVWERFGDVANYVEPFFGGGAVFLNRPAWHTGKVETVNDINAFLTNFWRAVKADPDAVAHHADWPVNEIDLMARRDWLFRQTADVDRLSSDPDWYDAKLAGIWVWGVCSTIGNAWKDKSTHLGDAGRGESLREYFRVLQQRLERVRVMCGDWTRVTSPTVTTKHGLTGMFLDPPYIEGCDAVYGEHSNDVRDAVREYAIQHGQEMRIALCGYEGEHDMPPDWDCFAWKAKGGYGSQADGQGKVNAHRERIYFSPACLRVDLFQGMEARV